MKPEYSMNSLAMILIWNFLVIMFARLSDLIPPAAAVEKFMRANLFFFSLDLMAQSS